MPYSFHNRWARAGDASAPLLAILEPKFGKPQSISVNPRSDIRYIILCIVYNVSQVVGNFKIAINKSHINTENIYKSSNASWRDAAIWIPKYSYSNYIVARSICAWALERARSHRSNACTELCCFYYYDRLTYTNARLRRRHDWNKCQLIKRADRLGKLIKFGSFVYWFDGEDITLNAIFYKL